MRKPRKDRKDLAGKKFGRLTVISPIHFCGWNCICDCGKEVIARDSYALTSGNTKSCGCLKHSQPGPRRDLSGMKFGKLAVIGLGGRYRHEYCWKCRCECGNIKEVCVGELAMGLVTSCGCSNGFRLGNQYGKLPQHRAAIIANILSGKTSPHKNSWKYRKQTLTTKGGQILCQSSWEEILARYLDNNSAVVKFEKDSVRIPYTYQGKTRVYIVDFLVTYGDEKLELVEIKAEWQLELDEVPAKFQAARIWCVERNIDFVVITEHELKLIGG